MVEAPGMLLIVGKMLKEACVVHAVPVRFMCHYCYPPNQSDLLEERDCSSLVHFSTTFLCRIWTDLAWELKLEGFSALFSFSLSGILFLFLGTVIVWSF